MFFLLKKHKDQKYLNALQRFAGESDFLFSQVYYT